MWYQIFPHLSMNRQPYGHEHQRSYHHGFPLHVAHDYDHYHPTHVGYPPASHSTPYDYRLGAPGLGNGFSAPEQPVDEGNGWNVLHIWESTSSQSKHFGAGTLLSQNMQFTYYHGAYSGNLQSPLLHWEWKDVHWITYHDLTNSFFVQFFLSMDLQYCCVFQGPISFFWQKLDSMLLSRCSPMETQCIDWIKNRIESEKRIATTGPENVDSAVASPALSRRGPSRPTPYHFGNTTVERDTLPKRDGFPVSKCIAVDATGLEVHFDANLFVLKNRIVLVINNQLEVSQEMIPVYQCYFDEIGKLQYGWDKGQLYVSLLAWNLVLKGICSTTVDTFEPMVKTILHEKAIPMKESELQWAISEVTNDIHLLLMTPRPPKTSQRDTPNKLVKTGSEEVESPSTTIEALDGATIPSNRIDSFLENDEMTMTYSKPIKRKVQ
jgi:hypothetical protein